MHTKVVKKAESSKRRIFEHLSSVALFTDEALYMPPAPPLPWSAEDRSPDCPPPSDPPNDIMPRAAVGSKAPPPDDAPPPIRLLPG